MVLIIKKLIPVYDKSDNVPKKYLNLRKAVYVTTFKYFYPNIEEILQKEYGLKSDEKIVVFWTKEISLPHFNRYRLKFRKVFSGKVRELGEWIRKYKKNVKTAKSSQMKILRLIINIAIYTILLVPKFKISPAHSLN